MMQANRFIRFSTAILDEPKVMKLPPETFRFWTLCLLATHRIDRLDSRLPSNEDLAFATRMQLVDVVTNLELLAAAGLVEKGAEGFTMICDWPSIRGPIDPTAAERQRRRRAKQATARD